MRDLQHAAQGPHRCQLLLWSHSQQWHEPCSHATLYDSSDTKMQRAVCCGPAADHVHFGRCSCRCCASLCSIHMQRFSCSMFHGFSSCSCEQINKPNSKRMAYVVGSEHACNADHSLLLEISQTMGYRKPLCRKMRQEHTLELLPWRDQTLPCLRTPQSSPGCQAQPLGWP